MSGDGAEPLCLAIAQALTQHLAKAPRASDYEFSCWARKNDDGSVTMGTARLVDTKPEYHSSVGVTIAAPSQPAEPVKCAHCGRSPGDKEYCDWIECAALSPAEPVAQAEQQPNPMLCPLCEADRSKEPCQGANPLKCHFAATAYAAEPAQQPQEALPPLPEPECYVLGRECTEPRYTADQMNERYLQGFRDGSRAPVPEAELTDEQIIEVAAEIGSRSLNMTRFHELGGKTTNIMDNAGVIEFARAILAAAKEPR